MPHGLTVSPFWFWRQCAMTPFRLFQKNTSSAKRACIIWSYLVSIYDLSMTKPMFEHVGNNNCNDHLRESNSDRNHRGIHFENGQAHVGGRVYKHVRVLLSCMSSISLKRTSHHKTRRHCILHHKRHILQVRSRSQLHDCVCQFLRSI